MSSGDFVTIEVLTHHANDDAERMVKGDPGAESVFYWDKQRKGVDRRGAGPMNPTLFGRGAGEGLGVHICTGPVAVKEAEPGDILEVRIIDVKPRPCANPQHKGKSFGSNAAAWWVSTSIVTKSPELTSTWGLSSLLKYPQWTVLSVAGT